MKINRRYGPIHSNSINLSKSAQGNTRKLMSLLMVSGPACRPIRAGVPRSWRIQRARHGKQFIRSARRVSMESDDERRGTA